MRAATCCIPCVFFFLPPPSTCPSVSNTPVNSPEETGVRWAAAHRSLHYPRRLDAAALLPAEAASRLAVGQQGSPLGPAGAGKQMVRSHLKPGATRLAPPRLPPSASPPNTHTHPCHHIPTHVLNYSCAAVQKIPQRSFFFSRHR